MANQYSMDILTIPALESGQDDAPAPAIAQGAQLNCTHVTAAVDQHRARKHLRLAQHQWVTEEELVASKRRKHLVLSANFDGATPVWAQQMHAAQLATEQRMQQMQEQMHRAQLATEQRMQEQMHAAQLATEQRLQQIQEQMQQMQEQMQQMHAGQNRILYKQSQDSGRAENRLRRNPGDPIVSIVRLLDGLKPEEQQPIPLWFSQSQNHFFGIPGARLDPLLAFYDLNDEGNLEVKTQRLMKHLGISLLPE